MRVAVLADTHGNAYALDAVLEAIRQAAPDLIVNLGDQAEGAADPARAVAMQAQLAEAGALEVRGNNEEKLRPGGRRTPLAQAFGAWLEGQVSGDALARIAALPLTARTPGGELLACHGTPQSAWDSLLWAWQPEGEAGQGFYRSRDPRELRPLLEGLGTDERRADVVVCGHTHRAGATRVGETLLVNCGSVSDQIDGDPRARWTLLERRSGHWAVDFRAEEYDVEAAVRWAQQFSPFGPFVTGLLRHATFDGRAAR